MGGLFHKRHVTRRLSALGPGHSALCGPLEAGSSSGEWWQHCGSFYWRRGLCDELIQLTTLLGILTLLHFGHLGAVRRNHLGERCLPLTARPHLCFPATKVTSPTKTPTPRAGTTFVGTRVRVGFQPSSGCELLYHQHWVATGCSLEFLWRENVWYPSIQYSIIYKNSLRLSQTLLNGQDTRTGHVEN